MSTYAIGSDNINGKEQSYINQAIQAVQDAGHTGSSLGVGPNKVQSYGQSSGSQDQIGVMIVGGRGLGTPIDFHTGVTQGYYHYTHVYVVGSSEFTNNRLISTESMSTPVNACEPGMSSSQCSQYLGLTPTQFNQKFNGCTVIYADSFSDALSQMLGGSTGSEESTSGGTFKDAVNDLISVWDGLVEVKCDGRIMNIRRIREPEEPEPLSRRTIKPNSTGSFTLDENEVWDEGFLREPEIWASEGVNIIEGSLSMTDYNPDTVNTLYVTYTDDAGVFHKLKFWDEYLVTRFDEIEKTEAAVWYKHSSESESSTDSTDSSTTDSSNSGTASLASTTGDTTSDTTSSTTSTTSSSLTTSTTKNTATPIPLKTYEEALRFGKGEWYKLQRENGHKVECKVIGTSDWIVGRWCKIYLPLFGEYTNMYIDKVNHSLEPDSEWTTSLELLPAPSCISEDTSSEESEDEESEEETTEEEDSSEESSSEESG